MEHVAIGVILRGDKVLISKREKSSHEGGLWEFPGGKKEDEESIRQTLSRELAEELGIKVINSNSIFSVLYDYTEKMVKLDFFLIKNFSGEPFGVEGQIIKWECVNSLNPSKFPKANYSIIEWLKNRI